jgi:hypothetical protein
MVFFAGCTETRTTNESQTRHADSVTVSGSASIPSPTGTIFVPIEFKIERTGTEDQHTEGESKTKIDSAVIAQQVGDVVGKLVDAGIAKVTGMQPKGLSLTEGGGLAGAGTAMAWALREMMARRREEKALVEVKEARNQAQRDALEMAKKLPPDQA